MKTVFSSKNNAIYMEAPASAYPTLAAIPLVESVACDAVDGRSILYELSISNMARAQESILRAMCETGARLVRRDRLEPIDLQESESSDVKVMLDNRLCVEWSGHVGLVRAGRSKCRIILGEQSADVTGDSTPITMVLEAISRRTGYQFEARGGHVDGSSVNEVARQLEESSKQESIKAQLLAPGFAVKPGYDRYASRSDALSVGEMVEAIVTSGQLGPIVAPMKGPETDDDVKKKTKHSR